mmetsp:Transcript_17944/g.26633  ORF Transcript_17944/g.26633 Transcript_17944/m.26633 type:complete len:143 (-) Transcript_17944:104-532(-)
MDVLVSSVFLAGASIASFLVHAETIRLHRRHRRHPKTTTEGKLAKRDSKPCQPLTPSDVLSLSQSPPLRSSDVLSLRQSPSLFPSESAPIQCLCPTFAIAITSQANEYQGSGEDAMEFGNPGSMNPGVVVCRGCISDVGFPD